MNSTEVFQRKMSKWSKTHMKKMLTIPQHQLHFCQNGYHQHKQQTLAGMWGKMNPHTLLVGM
jgi:UDP-N-acetyl-D-mannosaminuronic acid transferase (WecB/TagA/CpsF family)